MKARKSDYRNAVQALFTTATEILEDAHPAATTGQSMKRSRAQYVQKARELARSAQKLEACARAILKACRQSDTP